MPAFALGSSPGICALDGFTAAASVSRTPHRRSCVEPAARAVAFYSAPSPTNDPQHSVGQQLALTRSRRGGSRGMGWASMNGAAGGLGGEGIPPGRA